jgi:hypothetical protein
MARTEPAAAAAPKWRLPMLIRWAVPLAAAATAVALWVNVADRPATPPASDAAQAIDRLEQAPKATAPAEVPAAPPAAAAAPAAPAREGDRSKDAARNRAGALARAPAPPPAPPAPRDRAAEGQTQQRADRQAAAAAPEAAREKAEFRAFAGARPADVISPDPAIRWRIEGRIVQRSTDGGATWTAQSPDAEADLLAGHAPAPDVAWIVGRAATIRLTTDGGRTWRRITFPVPVDLTGVRAVDAMTASVTAADGRVFGTKDGGATWSLQETPARPF